MLPWMYHHCSFHQFNHSKPTLIIIYKKISTFEPFKHAYDNLTIHEHNSNVICQFKDPKVNIHYKTESNIGTCHLLRQKKLYKYC